ncbi:MAG: glucokinase [Thauera sp.]|nr:glucokinase [Thauera sp.]
MILCGDIGATKSLLGLAERHGDSFRIGFVQRYENRDWPSFARLIDDFLAAAGAATDRVVRLDMAGFGVAGPVGPDGVRMTNRDWQISDDALRTLLGGAPVCLLNDFEASACGIGDLPPDGLLTLQRGETAALAPQLVIGAGSGLGVAFRLPGPDGARVVAGEGGHVGFAPRNARQAGLWLYLHERFGRVSAEHVVSGPGLVRIHDWLCDEVESAADRGEDVWARALAGDARAGEALATFVDAYGAVAGDHALSVLARGGVYLTGGIAPRLLPAAAASFLSAFRDKGPHSELAAGFPVHLVTDEHLPLLGAARAAWQHA